jgi:hypothetical protein
MAGAGDHTLFKVETVERNHWSLGRYLSGKGTAQGAIVVWLDDSHRQVEYRADHDRYLHCENRVADVTVICALSTAGEN